MKLDIKYGRQSLALDIPEPPKCLALRSGGPAGKKITAEDVYKALASPVDSPPYAQIFSKDETVTVIVPDLTRYSGAEIYLPPMLDMLNESGIEDGIITVLFANGIHRAMTKSEMENVVGADVCRRVLCVNHDARSSDLAEVHVENLDKTVRLNRLVVECGKLIITGVAGFHYLAGFGGGRKSVMPGVASIEDAEKFHFLSLNQDRPGRNDNTVAGRIESNPMSDYAQKVMEAVKPAFLLNTVQDPDGTAVEVYAGSPDAAFGQGIEAVRRRSGVNIERLADVVVASCGGFPKDINFIQAHKTFEYASRALKPGGKLFLAAECADGPGSDSFIKWFEYGDPENMEKAIRENFHINGQTALATAIKAARYETVLLSSMPDETVNKMGIGAATSAEAFIAESEEALRGANCGYVIAEGGYLLPELGERAA